MESIMKKQHKVLFVHYGDNWIRGSERCLIDHLNHLDKESFKAFVWTNSDALHAEVERLGFTSVLDPFSLLFGWQTPQLNLSGWWNLVKKGKLLVQNWEIDLIHVNSAAPCQWMNRVAKLTNTPLVTQLHSGYPARDRLTLGIHFSPQIIAVSHAVTEYLNHDGYPSSNMTVIHNGVDSRHAAQKEAIDIRQQLGLSKDDVILITVGSLIKRKGIDRIITAMRHIVLESPHAHLVVVGSGAQRNQLEQITDSLHLNDHIHFVGEQHNSMSWLKGADIFISGARNEPFGLVITEAALAELPIIAPLTGGIPEIIEHTKHGLLYKNVGIKPLVESIRVVLRKPNEAKAMGKRAKLHVQSNYSIERNTNAISQLYLKMLRERLLPRFSLRAALRPLFTYMAKRISMGGV
jgi:L-malate glycosyltransferase